MIKIGLLLTVRLKSTRLPLKALREIQGKSLIQHIIDRARNTSIFDNFVLCTSYNHQDLPLILVAIENQLKYFAGDEDNVIERLYKASNLFGFDYFINISGDNPLFSFKYTNKLVEYLQKDHGVDYIFTSGLPLGMNVQGIKVSTLKKVCEVNDIKDTEIWGYYLNQPDYFNVVELNVEQADALPVDRVTIDEESDLAMFSEIISSFHPDELITEPMLKKLFLENRSIFEINKDVVQKYPPSSQIDRINKIISSNFQSKSA